MPRVVYYLSLSSGVLTLPLAFIMFIRGLGLFVVLGPSTLLAGLSITWAAISFETEPKARLQGGILVMSGVALAGVLGSGLWHVSVWTLSGPFLGLVASISFLVGERVSFFW
jgi:hypothetical protein